MKPYSIKQSLLAAASFCLFLWSVVAVSVWLDINITRWGVYPLEASGLAGILFAPLIHGSWSHISANTAPLIILGGALLMAYPKSRWWALGFIWLVSGTGVWLLARPSFHFGASGLTHGLFFYLFIIGLLRRDKKSTALLMIAFFLYGGMMVSIFPSEPGISYEYHMAGALAGVLAAIIWRKADPLPEKKRYSWDNQDDSYLDEDPYWQELEPPAQETRESSTMTSIEPDKKDGDRAP